MTEASPSLLPYRPCSRSESIFAAGFALALGALLAAGFLPTSKQAYAWLQTAAHLPSSLGVWGEMAAFPLLAGFFLFSLPPWARRFEPARAELRWWRTLPVPCFIAFLYGIARGNPTLVAAWLRYPKELVWSLLFIPLGEEWLFRGWTYAIFERRWPGRLVTLTNALPVAVWASALAFSLWHLQNLTSEPPAIVALQVVYSFFTGLWLGYVRWTTGRLAPGWIAHVALNLAANLL